MSILIEGMQMPKERYVDIRIFADGRATTATGERPFYREMHIIEVPNHHGKLIDADELLKYCNIYLLQTTNESCVPVSDIEDAPTVIPPSDIISVNAATESEI